VLVNLSLIAFGALNQMFYYAHLKQQEKGLNSNMRESKTELLRLYRVNQLTLAMFLIIKVIEVKSM
jgi:hypothetical protein